LEQLVKGQGTISTAETSNSCFYRFHDAAKPNMCIVSRSAQPFTQSQKASSKVEPPTAEYVSPSNVNLNHDETSNLSNIYDTFDGLVDMSTNEHELNLNLLNPGMDEYDYSAELTPHEVVMAEGQNVALTPICTNLGNEPLRARAEEDDFNLFVPDALTTGYGNDAESGSSSRAVDGCEVSNSWGEMSDMTGVVINTSKVCSKIRLSKEDEAAATLAASACLSNLAEDIAAAAEVCIGDCESHASFWAGFSLPPLGSHIDHTEEEALCSGYFSKHPNYLPSFLERNEDEREIFKEPLNQDDIVQAIVAAAVDVFDDVKSSKVHASSNAMQVQVQIETSSLRTSSYTERKRNSYNKRSLSLNTDGNPMKVKKTRLLTALDSDLRSQKINKSIIHPPSCDLEKKTSLFFNNGGPSDSGNINHDSNIDFGETDDLHVGDNNNIIIINGSEEVNPHHSHLEITPLRITKNAKQTDSKSQSELKWDDMFYSLCTFIEEKKQHFLKENEDNPLAVWVWDGNVPTSHKVSVLNVHSI